MVVLRQLTLVREIVRNFNRLMGRGDRARYDIKCGRVFSIRKLRQDVLRIGVIVVIGANIAGVGVKRADIAHAIMGQRMLI